MWQQFGLPVLRSEAALENAEIERAANKKSLRACVPAAVSPLPDPQMQPLQPPPPPPPPLSLSLSPPIRCRCLQESDEKRGEAAAPPHSRGARAGALPSPREGDHVSRWGELGAHSMEGMPVGDSDSLGDLLAEAH
jgi:hypothetical protein